MHLYFDTTLSRTYAFRVSIDHFEAVTVSGLSKYILDNIGTAKIAKLVFQFQNSAENTTQEVLVYNQAAKRYR